MCERKGKFRAQYVGPCVVTKIHLQECKCSGALAKVEIAQYQFQVHAFD